MSCGGVLRDSDDTFHRDFLFKGHECNYLSTELQALVLELEFAWSKNIHRVIMETYVSNVMQMIYHGVSSHYHYYSLI